MLLDAELHAHGLGLPRASIVLAEHDPRWRVAFEREREILLSALPGIDLALEHVGSTAVPGLIAKPILDVMGWCREVSDLDARSSELAALGYAYKGEYGIPDRRYCVRHDAPGEVSFIHLHLYPAGHDDIGRLRTFRDRLRTRSDLALEYRMLKIALQHTHRGDRAGYVAGKSRFIRAQIDPCDEGGAA